MAAYLIIPPSGGFFIPCEKETVMPEMTPEEQKEIVRAAIEKAARDWLNDMYAMVGKWTVRGITAMALVALIVFLGRHGFRLDQFVITP